MARAFDHQRSPQSLLAGRIGATTSLAAAREPAADPPSHSSANRQASSSVGGGSVNRMRSGRVHLFRQRRSQSQSGFADASARQSSAHPQQRGRFRRERTAAQDPWAALFATIAGVNGKPAAASTDWGSRWLVGGVCAGLGFPQWARYHDPSPLARGGPDAFEGPSCCAGWAVASVDGSLLGSYAVGVAGSAGGSRIPKPMARCFVRDVGGCGVAIHSARRKGPAADYSHQITKGMTTWGFVGDLCMTFSVPLGMATLGIGHVSTSEACCGCSKPKAGGWDRDRWRHGG